MRSALTNPERDLLRAWLSDRPRRTIATWHTVQLPGSRRRVRVVLTTWGRRDVMTQEAITVETLADAWHVVVTWLGVPNHVAADTRAFLGWATLGKR